VTENDYVASTKRIDMEMEFRRMNLWGIGEGKKDG
jgi:hypothetical protein